VAKRITAVDYMAHLIEQAGWHWDAYQPPGSASNPATRRLVVEVTQAEVATVVKRLTELATQIKHEQTRVALLNILLNETQIETYGAYCCLYWPSLYLDSLAEVNPFAT